jgi:hypothetical protein
MAAKQQEEPRAGPEKQSSQQLTDTISRHVLLALGRPQDLHRMQVRKLWEDNYRVNVFTGPDAATAKVAHSYFLVVDGGGNITTSTPVIVRQY